MMTSALTRAELQAMPTVIDLPTAARTLGLGRTKAYELAKAGEFPCRGIRAGRRYQVPTAEVLRLVGLSTDETPP
jgi:predicted DNA-binding transcriptional regulator AlpA